MPLLEKAQTEYVKQMLIRGKRRQNMRNKCLLWVGKDRLCWTNDCSGEGETKTYETNTYLDQGKDRMCETNVFLQVGKDRTCKTKASLGQGKDRMRKTNAYSGEGKDRMKQNPWRKKKERQNETSSPFKVNCYAIHND